MIETLEGARFFLDFAKAILDWCKGKRKNQAEYTKEVAAILKEFARCIAEYAALLEHDPIAARGKIMEHRAYLEEGLSYLASLLAKGNLDPKNEPLRKAVDRLAHAKASDEVLIEVRSLVRISDALIPPRSSRAFPEHRRRQLLLERFPEINQLHEAAGLFRAAADAITLGSR